MDLWGRISYRLSFIYADEIFIIGALEADDITKAFECEKEYIQPSGIYDEDRTISALLIDENGEVSEFSNISNRKITVLWWD